MNICLHVFGRPLAHVIVRKGYYYVTITAFGRRWHVDSLPSYTHPE